MYPVMLNLEGRHCLVVGGGGVALRKVQGILADGAEVTVVALNPIPALDEMAQKGEIHLELRAYSGGEAKSFALVFAATDDEDVNRQVFEDADMCGIWVNVADDPEKCTFHLPARCRRGSLQLAVASAGEAPFVTRRLRQLLERRFGPEWAEWIEAAARFRKSVHGQNLTIQEQERCFDSFFKGTVDPERLTATLPTARQEAAWLGVADSVSPSQMPPPVTGAQDNMGFVSLVGAGPGDRAAHRAGQASPANGPGGGL